MTEETIQEAAEQQEPQKEISNEDLAREQGWTDKETFVEKYNGDPERWVSADEFLKKSESEMPVLKDRLRKTAAENKALKEDFERFRKQNESVMEAMKAQYTEELGQLKAQKRKAVEDGDTDEFDRLEKKEEFVKSAAEKFQEPAPVEEPKLDDTIKQWADQSDWYDNDMAATTFADMLAPKIAAKFPDSSIEERLDLLEKEVQRAHPHLFDNKKSVKKPPRMEGSTRAAPVSSKQNITINDLPAEEKASAQRFLRRHKIEEGSDEYKKYINNVGISLGLKKPL